MSSSSPIRSVLAAEPEQASAPTIDDPSQLDAITQSTVPCDNTLVDELTDQLTSKVKDALLDGRFSMKETAGLTLSVCSAVQALFPLYKGSDKKQIAISVLHTIIRGLILLNLLTPEFNVALSVLPGVIDSVIYITGGIEALWDRYMPAFFAWLRNIVWGDDKTVIEQQHVAAIVDRLDVTSVSGLKAE